MAADLGCMGFDLVRPQDWPILKKYGLTPTMSPQNAGVSIPDGMNVKENHDQIEKTMRPAIDECAAGGCPNLITFSGNRRGMADAEGADNCVAMFEPRESAGGRQGRDDLPGIAEQQSQPQRLHVRPHGLGRGGSETSQFAACQTALRHLPHADHGRRRLPHHTDNFQWIAHFHTGGVPGRHEIDETQELNYRLVAKTIADLGYTGFITHEYTPAPGRDPRESLKQAIEIMTV